MTTTDTTNPMHPTAADLTALATRRTADRAAVDTMANLLATAAEVAAEARRFHAEADKGFLPAPHRIRDNDEARRRLGRELRELAEALAGPRRADEIVPGAEKQIRELVEAQPGLRFGYIGNFERWGDDRKLFVWIEGQREASGNTASVWSCPATQITRRELSAAKCAVRDFGRAYKAGQAAAKA